MNKHLLNLIGVAILALVATSTWAVWEWGGVGQSFRVGSPALVQKMDKILDRVGDPKNGTIAEIDKTIVGTKSLIVHADLVARHEQQQLDVWDARGTTLFNNVNGTITDARSTIKQSTQTMAEATTAIKAVESVPTHLNEVADQVRASLIPLPDTLKGLTNASNGFASVAVEMATYVHGPLTFATNNAGELADTVNTATVHVDHRWLAPWDGSHPFKHYLGAGWNYGYSLANLGAQISIAKH